MTPDTDDRRSATEDRLRAALTARAALVTHRELRCEAPPQGRGWGVRRAQRLALAVLGAAAAVVAGCLLALLPGGPLHPAPVPPARPAGVSRPASPPSAPARPVGPSVTDPGCTPRTCLVVPDR